MATDCGQSLIYTYCSGGNVDLIAHAVGRQYLEYYTHLADSVMASP